MSTVKIIPAIVELFIPCNTRIGKIILGFKYGVIGGIHVVIVITKAGYGEIGLIGDISGIHFWKDYNLQETPS